VNRGWFRKRDPRIHRGRRKGSKNRPKQEAPFRCPYCGKGMGKAWVRKPMRLDQVPARMRQLSRTKNAGKPRKGRRRFEKGYDPSRCLTGRLIGKCDSHPRVPSRCTACGRAIEKVWRPILIRRWRHSHPQ
jgi:DNA-directed RNA polymerase subunit N (RpoN/RPB10)